MLQLLTHWHLYISRTVAKQAQHDQHASGQTASAASRADCSTLHTDTSSVSGALQAKHAQHTSRAVATWRAVSAVSRRAAVAHGEAADVWPMGCLRLTPAVYAAAACGGNALYLLQPGIRLQLSL